MNQQLTGTTARYHIYALRTRKGRTVYIGQTINPLKRERQHVYRRFMPIGGSLVVLSCVDTPQEAKQYEDWWIITYRACGVKLRNIRIGGMLYDPEVRSKMSQSASTKRRLGILAEWNSRRIVTPEYRRKISNTLQGRKNPHRGHKQSAETVAKRIASIRARFNGGWRPQTYKCSRGLMEYNSRQRFVIP